MGELVVVGELVLAYPADVVVHHLGKTAVVPYTARLRRAAARGDLVV
jgi:hypothetical protein